MTTSGSGVHTDNAGDSGGTAGPHQRQHRLRLHGRWLRRVDVRRPTSRRRQRQHRLGVRRRPGRVRELQPRRRQPLPRRHRADGERSPATTSPAPRAAPGLVRLDRRASATATATCGSPPTTTTSTAPATGVRGRGDRWPGDLVTRQPQLPQRQHAPRAAQPRRHRRERPVQLVGRRPARRRRGVGVSVIAAPWLITSNLDGNCVPIMKVGPATKVVAEGNSGTTHVTVTVRLDRATYQRPPSSGAPSTARPRRPTTTTRPTRGRCTGRRADLPADHHPREGRRSSRTTRTSPSTSRTRPVGPSSPTTRSASRSSTTTCRR